MNSSQKRKQSKYRSDKRGAVKPCFVPRVSSKKQLPPLQGHPRPQPRPGPEQPRRSRDPALPAPARPPRRRGCGSGPGPTRLGAPGPAQPHGPQPRCGRRGSGGTLPGPWACAAGLAQTPGPARPRWRSAPGPHRRPARRAPRPRPPRRGCAAPLPPHGPARRPFPALRRRLLAARSPAPLASGPRPALRRHLTSDGR